MISHKKILLWFFEYFMCSLFVFLGVFLMMSVRIALLYEGGALNTNLSDLLILYSFLVSQIVILFVSPMIKPMNSIFVILLILIMGVFYA